MKNNNYITVIGKIKGIKNLKKMTNNELAQLSGIPLGTLNKILSGGTQSVKAETLNKIAAALNIDLNALYGASNNLLNESCSSYGYVKVGAYTPEIKVCDVDFNVKSIISGIDKALAKGVKLIVFPELSLTGSTAGDLFFQEALLKSARNGLIKIANYLKNKPIMAFVGLPFRVGGCIYNSLACVCGGEILGISAKSVILKNTEESRWFTAYTGKTETVKIGDAECLMGTDILYRSLEEENFTVSVKFDADNVDNGAFIVVNPSATYETVGAMQWREKTLTVNSLNFVSAYVYANAGYGESTSDVVYAGNNYVVENGKILAESKLFSTGITVSDVDVDFLAFERTKKGYVNSAVVTEVTFNIGGEWRDIDRTYTKTPFIPEDKNEIKSRSELILNMQAQALLKRINHVNCKTLVVGVSGGLDSTLALLVCKRAIDLAGRNAKDIIAVTMPCFGTTSRTKNNAVVLSEALGVTLKEINIKDAVRVHFKDIGHDENVTDVTYENAQARERTQVLMDIANKTGGLVIGTGDLSELALGWATYNGDHMSMYGVNASVPKTLIRYLVSYEASKSDKVIKDVLLDVLDTPVSPELVPSGSEEISQKTEDIVGPYLLHDFYIYHAIRNGFKPSKIFYIAKRTFNGEFDDKTLYKWLTNFYNRFFVQQFKRNCVPDGVKIGSVSFSPRGDFRMPSDAIRQVWLEDLKNLIIE